MKRSSPRKIANRMAVGGLVIAAGLSIQGTGSATAFDNPIANSELEAQSGREGTTVVDITSAISQMDGQSTGNVASNTTNGGNVINDQAFSGFNGHATVIQNSGNNNVIQDSTIYNFSLQQ